MPKHQHNSTDRPYSFGDNFPIHPDGKDRGIRLREYAAIHLRVPKSGLPWLDDMIKLASERDAGVAALCNSHLAEDQSVEDFVDKADAVGEDFSSFWEEGLEVLRE